jgi:hypothetical protein
VVVSGLKETDAFEESEVFDELSELEGGVVEGVLSIPIPT